MCEFIAFVGRLAIEVKSIEFTEQYVQVFGQTAISRGRLQLDSDILRLDQRFLRVYSKRDGIWRAVSVAVTPIPKG